jgi:CVNH domain.
MKKTLLYTALVLGLFPVGYANAGSVNACTTDNTPGLCWGCKLQEPTSGFFSSSGGWRLACTTPGFDGEDYHVSKEIDDCVENREGTMGHGRGATQSCQNFTLEGNELHADCRNGQGEYLHTSIDISRYFEWPSFWTISCVE